MNEVTPVRVLHQKGKSVLFASYTLSFVKHYDVGTTAHTMVGVVTAG